MVEGGSRRRRAHRSGQHARGRVLRRARAQFGCPARHRASGCGNFEAARLADTGGWEALADPPSPADARPTHGRGQEVVLKALHSTMFFATLTHPAIPSALASKKASSGFIARW